MAVASEFAFDVSSSAQGRGCSGQEGRETKIHYQYRRRWIRRGGDTLNTTIEFCIIAITVSAIVQPTWLYRSS